MWLKRMFGQADKCLHFLAGMVLGMYFTVLTAVLVAVGKEWWDRRSYGVFDKDDMWMTIFGGVVGQLIVLFIFVL